MSDHPSLLSPASRLGHIYGWSALLFFLLFGLFLEALHLFKAPFYMEVELRRELWTLAHAHGALLAIVNIVFALAVGKLLSAGRKALMAARSLAIGAALVPAGFFLGAVIGNSEGDPGLLIFLTPIGALLLLHAVAVMAVASWKLRSD